MSDDDRSSLLGSIISLVLLVILWPYILAAIYLFITYLMLVALFNWVMDNLPLVLSFMAGILLIYLVIRLQLIPKAYRLIIKKLDSKARQVNFSKELPLSAERHFSPSTNLYCYYCTKKLGIQAYELKGHYFCDECYKSQLKS